MPFGAGIFLFHIESEITPFTYLTGSDVDIIIYNSILNAEEEQKHDLL